MDPKLEITNPRVFLPAPVQMTFCSPEFSEKTILPLLKMTSELLF